MVKNGGKKFNKIDLPVLFCVSLAFLWLSEAFQSDSSGFQVLGFPLDILFLYGKENRDPKTHWNRFEMPPNYHDEQQQPFLRHYFQVVFHPI